MADLCQACQCPPDVTYSNVCCCPPQFGISVMQPTCQVLPGPCGQDGPIVVNNPCYCQADDVSTWTYKFFTDCSPGQETSGISHFLIPICEDIPQEDITVEEKVNCCTDFYTVEFSLETDDPNLGPPPEGFIWLKVENPTPPRYDKGVCVAYRIRIAGNYPAVEQAIKVKAGQNDLTFCGDDPCFLVPGCISPASLSVDKTCSTVISNNVATINYTVTVTNNGGQPATNVLFSDVITYDSTNLTVGTIDVNPSPPLTFDDSVPGEITISGNIGTINGDGGTFAASYSVTFSSIAAPGTYTIDNTATATADGGITASDSDSCTIEAVQLMGGKCCTITNGNQVTFQVTVSTVDSSPATVIDLVDQLTIPEGVTVSFTSFNGCTAVFPDNTPVPLSPDTVTGPVTITIRCNNLPVPGGGGSVQRNISFNVVSTSVFNCASASMIANTLQQATGLNTSTQVYLPPMNVPSTASVSVLGCVTCNNPCI